MTSFGGRRWVFDLDLPALDLLTLNADEDVNLLLLLPFEDPFEDPLEDPLAGPLEEVGAIMIIVGTVRSRSARDVYGKNGAT